MSAILNADWLSCFLRNLTAETVLNLWCNITSFWSNLGLKVRPGQRELEFDWLFANWTLCFLQLDNLMDRRFCFSRLPVCTENIVQNGNLMLYGKW